MSRVVRLPLFILSIDKQPLILKLCETEGRAC
jgi:hypothetical protein